MNSEETNCPTCGRPTLKFFRKVGRFRCTDEDCGEEFLAEQIQTSAETGAETLDLETLPFPVAYPLAHARDTRLSARDRGANAIFAAYQAMRTTALLLLAPTWPATPSAASSRGRSAGCACPTGTSGVCWATNNDCTLVNS